MLTASLLPHVDILLREAAVEEHVEEFLRTDVSLEAAVIIVVLAMSMVSASVAMSALRLIDAI